MTAPDDGRVVLWLDQLDALAQLGNEYAWLWKVRALDVGAEQAFDEFTTWLAPTMQQLTEVWDAVRWYARSRLGLDEGSGTISPDGEPATQEHGPGHHGGLPAEEGHGS